jgi:hypothetical protein
MLVVGVVAQALEELLAQEVQVVVVVGQLVAQQQHLEPQIWAVEVVVVG